MDWSHAEPGSMDFLFWLLLSHAVRTASALCVPEGVWRTGATAGAKITVQAANGHSSAVLWYNATCSGCGWRSGHISWPLEGDVPSGEFVAALDNGVSTAGRLSADCDTILWQTVALGNTWYCPCTLPPPSAFMCVPTTMSLLFVRCRCGSSCPVVCSGTVDSGFWRNGSIHFLEVAHSDIGWLGLEDDLLIDADQVLMPLH